MRVKICGITNSEDAEGALLAGAWAIGLNNHPDSPRYCDPDTAAEIGASFKRRCEVAGVFVEVTLDRLAAMAEEQSLSLIQLHGDQGPSFCAEAARRTGCKIIKAFRVRSSAEIQHAAAFRTDFHLFDAYAPGLAGGTGQVFDYSLVKARRTREVPALVAGGLTPDNVADAIAQAKPWGVDVAGGVESQPGRKDHDAIRQFIAAAKATEPDPAVGGERE